MMVSKITWCSYPILRDYQIPMITYLTTDFVNNNEMSWIDKIEHCLELTKKKEILLNKKIHNIKIVKTKFFKSCEKLL